MNGKKFIQTSFMELCVTEVDRIWAKGKDVIFDVDVVGGVNIKKIYGDKALSIFVMPPSIECFKRKIVESFNRIRRKL